MVTNLGDRVLPIWEIVVSQAGRSWFANLGGRDSSLCPLELAKEGDESRQLSYRLKKSWNVTTS